MDHLLLYSKLAMLPEGMKLEVSDFIDSLYGKLKKGKDIEPINQPKFGSAKGLFVMHDDFDAPLEDFKDYM